ncbi:uncharacterized protein (TIGR02231 family) [Thermosporothrix hazakensis]|jgi:uncharacterized protein (TIGR02231 family)|uniref:Uncharacterized protein (TIGR02231 family) n=2 Tax=Thermosporothrix TaxID=768650 RepID=A0A326UES2_THEHA|nr:mucoidy inhibitor MuiA family protein [Thermosporothrix hazakensis]PZW36361.1 uncharacterized protein (TIGR02231 family) [Thermosporothrix hazakensis]BBH88826.1 hypothetical protein KTC_35770 [Thermosporothrix sp. COM3]GCE47010.1 hypothetical protein KTH_18790 [Thermosporothrix hazakensis]
MPAINASIQEVTVYNDRALITRRGTIHLPAGEHEVEVQNLPQHTIQRESLRAAGTGPEGTRILNVELQTQFYSRAPEEDLTRLDQEIEELEQQQRLLEAQQGALQDRQQWLRALGEESKEFAHGLSRGTMRPQDCTDFFRFAAQQALDDARASLDLHLQLQKLLQDIDARKRERQQKQGNQSPDRLTARVTIELPTEGDFTLELSYLVTGASWEPRYDVRVATSAEQETTGDVELTYNGMVTQQTGETWNEVRISLSTARPSLAAVLPELRPWYLKEHTPPVPFARAAQPAMRYSMLSASKIAESSDMPAGAPPLPPEPAAAPASISTAEIESSGAATVFHIGHSVDIPSDGSPHKTTIVIDKYPCEFDYVCAPALEKVAHLRGTITNTSASPLLAGQASIFLDGNYVGTTEIKLTAPGEQFRVFLGLDERLKVERKLTEANVEKGNLLQGDIRRLTYGYQITVQNYASTTRNIVVCDRLPVPQHERIKVRVTQLQPPPVERTKLELLTWKKALATDEKYTIDYRFVVEHPRDLRVVGLVPVEQE